MASIVRVLITALVLNAIWLLSGGCTVKVTSLGRPEGPGIKITITEKEPEKPNYGTISANYLIRD
jgi:hypothetical protein